MTGTPSQLTHIRSQIEQRDLQMQTAFPAKVLSWTASTNTVKLEPQFLEVWRDGESRMSEPIDRPEDAYIDNVPVLFPRSGTWSITFPIVNGSFGLVLCTKYSLDVWRKGNGKVVDPGDLRRFTMSGAVFFPVNLHPDVSTLKPVSSTTMNLAGSSDFVALADLINKFFKAFINATPGVADGGAAIQTAVKTAVTGGIPWNDAIHDVGSSVVKAGA
jgi:hypothetical protein